MSTSAAKESILTERLGGLTPARRALLAFRLKSKNIDLQSELSRSQTEPNSFPSAERRVDAIRPAVREDHIPLSYGQERMWFFDQLNPGSAAYNVPDAARLSGPLDVQALSRAFDEIVRRHEILRTNIVSERGVPRQVIHESSEARPLVVDLSEMDRPREIVEGLIERESGRGFDLSSGPLLRALLIRLDREEHVLFLVMHHIVCDGWSMSVFIREMSELYRVYSAGAESPPARPELQYADYAIWQRERMKGEVFDREIEYWRGKLGGERKSLQLPADRVRPAEQRMRGGRARLDLSRETTEALKRTARNEGATMFMLLLSAYKVMLSRLGGEREISVGTAIAGRTHREQEGMLGLFVNTLVMKSEVREQESFIEHLRREKETAVEAYSHQETPFEKIVEELEPERLINGSPLFEVMFNFQNAPLEGPVAEGLQFEQLYIDGKWSTFDLNLSIIEGSGERGLILSLEYSRELFEEETASRMLSYLVTLLDGIAANPEARIRDLPLLSPAQLKTMIVDWNAATAPVPQARSIVQLFEEQAKNRPDHCAIVYREERISYAMLDARANRLARRLHAQGIGAESKVVLVTERSVEMVVGMLGILKAGAAYIPLDPSYPRQRLAYMLEDAQPQAIVAQQHLLDIVPSTPAPKISVDELSPLLTDDDGLPLNIPIEGGTLAYCIYTSGSTGNPKGVQIEHRTLSNLLTVFGARFGLNAGEIWTVFHSFAFDFSVWELWAPLSVGATAVLVSPSAVKSPNDFYSLLKNERVTALHQTPSAFRQFLRMIKDKPGQFASLDLKRIVLGGEALPEELLAELPVESPELWNLYGPTEATVWSTFEQIDFLEKRPLIGRPIPNTQAYVLDASLRPVTPLQTGDLYLGGDQLSRGYLGNPQHTAEKFLPHPFRRGERLYKTGDLGRYLPDGRIEFIGRSDRQVKIRGYRIELGEIEAALNAHPAVRESLVIVRSELPEERSLVAYITSDQSKSPTVGSLRRFLQEKLPAYMVPSSYTMVDHFPLNANQKLDVQALLARSVDRLTIESHYVAPRSRTELILAKIWSEALKLDRIGVNDNFFELGGDSLLGLQTLARAHREGLLLTPSQLLEHPTIAALAKAAQPPNQVLMDPVLPNLVSMDPAPTGQRPISGGGRYADALEADERIEAIYPLSPMQQGMLFHTTLAPEAGTYLEQIDLAIEGDFDLDAFQNAWRRVMRNNAVLRTSFLWEGLDEPVQVVWRDLTPPINYYDLQSLAVDEQKARIENYISHEQHGDGFQLSAAPLMRLCVFRCSERSSHFVWSFHHAILDGWSIQLTLAEVYEEYQALLQRRSLSRAERRPYSDFIAWLGEQSAEQAEAAWREELAGFVSPIMLGLEKSSAPGAETKALYGEGRRLLTASQTARINEFARRSRLTLNTILQGAWAITLSRYSGERDVVFGGVVSGRPVQLQGAASMIGLFINTTPVRANIDVDAETASWLASFQARQTEMRRFEWTPLVKVQRWAELPAGESLFHSIFVFDQSQHPQDPDGGGWKSEHRSLQHTGYPIHLMAVPGNELLFRLTYLNSHFDQGSIDRLLSHYAAIVEEIAADPTVRLGAIRMLSESEQHQILKSWNATETRFPLQDTFLSAFEDQAARTPDHVAVFEADLTVNYRDLNETATRAAHALVKSGVRPGDVVGLLADRGIELLTSILAVLKAGACYLPIDPKWPAARSREVITESRCRLALTSFSLAAEFSAAMKPLGDGVRPVVRRIQDLIQNGLSLSNPLPKPDPAGLAYVIYTSGSTGAPKGAMVDHAGMLNHLQVKLLDLRLEPTDAIAQTASQCFDISVWQMLAGLLVGGAVRIVEDEIVRDPAALLDEIETCGISILEVVPSLLSVMLDEIDRTERRPPALASLRWLLVTGEALSPDLCRRWLRLYPEIPLLNAYGPTECSDDVTHHVVRVKPLEHQIRIPIGRPVSNMQAYILDANLDLAPPGVSGELFIGGIGVGPGYLFRPDLTAEKFIPDQFSGASGARLYHTGDLARRLPEGEIEFLGRIDHQVKIHGFRIELGEIEAALASHPAVKEAVVLARDDSPGEKRLVGYVSWRDQEVSFDELRRHLSERLPEYMTPRAFVALPQMPLSRNGKVDRKALPLPAAGAERPEREYTAPRNETESLLEVLWAQVLKQDRISIHDSFFSVGGHSLLATQVMSRVRETLRIEIPLKKIFETPTIAGLAAVIRRTRLEQSGLNAAPLVAQRKDSSRIPLSYGQERMWFFDQLNPGSAAYNVPDAARLSGPLDVQALSRAFDEIVRRHEILRTNIVSERGVPRQVIHESSEARPLVVDLSEMDRPREIVEGLIARESGRGFDLSSGPLLRALLIRLDREEHVLFLVMHHIVCDGWSMSVFIREMSDLYRAYAGGGESPLGRPELQYADYAIWQRERMKGEVFDREIEYWRGKLGGERKSLQLPADRVRPAEQRMRGGRTRRDLSRETTEALKRTARNEGATMFMLLMSAYKVMLSRLGGEREISVGTAIAGRTHREQEGMLGLFVNTLVMKSEVREQGSFIEHLRREKETAVEAYSHQETPFEKIVEELEPERLINGSPLFEVMFNFQNAPLEAPVAEGLKLEETPLERKWSIFDLSLSAIEKQGGLVLSLEYSRELFEEDTAARILDYYVNLLEAAAANPSLSLYQLKMIDEAERTLVLKAWNQTKAQYSSDRTVQSLISDQAARRPQSTAVISGGRSLSYRELEEESNRLARYLIGAGVEPEQLVGVCVERSERMVAALLGILKAGGAYVPMDPSYPSDRLSYMAEDSGMKVLVSESDVIERLPESIRESGVRIVSLDGERESIERENAEALEERTTGENLAYVIYTSGSTGRPKGVEISQRALVNFLETMIRKPGLKEDDRLLSVTSLSFDIAGLEIYLPLLAGARLEIATTAEASDGRKLMRRLSESGATVMQGTPSTWRLLTESGWRGDRKLKVLVGGEAIGEKQAWELSEQSREAWNMYGPTETTIWSSVQPLRSGEKVSLGAPVGNTQMYVLDERQEAVGIGVVGELYIGGDGLARGYLRRPELTAERFLPDSYGETEGSRLYRTGDLARRRRDGGIEYLGRTDQQVKLRGYRIELKEIEQRLMEHEGVKQAVAVVRGETDADKRLVAYLILEEGVILDSPELREFLRARLPEYMIPSFFMTLERTPLTPNGKIDRKALPAPAPEVRDYEAPRSVIEEDLVSIWSEILEVSPIGVHDNFFDLGGHSLLAMRLISRISEHFDVDISVRALFASPTISEMGADLGLALSKEGIESDERDLIDALEEIPDDELGALLEQIRIEVAA